jgi:hypothetical protein
MRLRIVVTLFLVVIAAPRLDAQCAWQFPGAGTTLFTPCTNLGVGTADPQANIHLFRPSGQSNIYIDSGGTTAGHGGVLRFLNAGVEKSSIRADFEPGSLIFETGGPGPQERMRIRANGLIGIGTADPLSMFHVAGDIRVDGNIAAKYQDVAEWVPATANVEPGTVVVLNASRSNEVMASMTAYDTAVAGVVSSQPGIILGEEGESKEKIATTGRVRVKVDATANPIKVGDLLVTSGKSGRAMKSTPLDLGGIAIHRPGTIIGKALEPLAKGEGEILVLLSMQ